MRKNRTSYLRVHLEDVKELQRAGNEQHVGCKKAIVRLLIGFHGAGTRLASLEPGGLRKMVAELLYGQRLGVGQQVLAYKQFVQMGLHNFCILVVEKNGSVC